MAVTQQIDFIGNNTVIGYATFIATLTITDEDTGDPIDLSDFDTVRAAFRRTHDETASPIFTLENAATDPVTDGTYQTAAHILAPATNGQVRLVISAIDTKAFQDDIVNSVVDELGAGEGAWDSICYTAATGSGNSYQVKVARGTWAFQISSTRPTP